MVPVGVFIYYLAQPYIPNEPGDTFLKEEERRRENWAYRWRQFKRGFSDATYTIVGGFCVGLGFWAAKLVIGA